LESGLFVQAFLQLSHAKLCLRRKQHCNNYTVAKGNNRVKNLQKIGEIEVLMAMSMKMAVFWDVSLRNLVNINQRWSLCLHRPDDVMETVNSHEMSVYINQTI
jgi:hypothetical protein